MATWAGVLVVRTPCRRIHSAHLFCVSPAPFSSLTGKFLVFPCNYCASFVVFEEGGYTQHKLRSAAVYFLGVRERLFCLGLLCVGVDCSFLSVSPFVSLLSPAPRPAFSVEVEDGEVSTRSGSCLGRTKVRSSPPVRVHGAPSPSRPQQVPQSARGVAQGAHRHGFHEGSAGSEASLGPWSPAHMHHVAVPLTREQIVAELDRGE